MQPYAIRALHKRIQEAVRHPDPKRRRHGLLLLDTAPTRYRAVVALLMWLGALNARQAVRQAVPDGIPRDHRDGALGRLAGLPEPVAVKYGSSP